MKKPTDKTFGEDLGISQESQERDFKKNQPNRMNSGNPQGREAVQENLNYDSQVIPTLKNKGNNQPQAYPDENSGGEGDREEIGGFENAEEIKLNDLKKAEPLIPMLSEGLVRGLFSKDWGKRDAAIKALGEEIKKGAKSELYSQSLPQD